MKVLLITNLYGRYARGGAERVVETIAEGLEAEGHRVAIFTAGEFDGLRSLWPKVDPRELRALRSSANDSVRRVYRFFPFNLFSIVNIGRYPLLLRFFWHAVDLLEDHSAWALWWIIKKEKPDIVWTHNLKGLGVWIPRCVRMLGVRHIHQLHDVQLLEPSGLLYSTDLMRPRPFGRLAYIRLYRWLMGSPALVVSPTQWLLELHKKSGYFKKSKLLVLSNPAANCPVRVPHSSPLLSSRPFDSVQRINGSPLQFLFVGQVVKHKGIAFLTDVLKSVQLPFSWELHIAGNGALEPKLRRELSNDARFIFHGRLSPHELEEVWSQTNLTIVPSLCLENAPTVIAESLVRGIPVLTSRVGGIPEMIEEGKNGWLFEAADRKDFLLKLEKAREAISVGFWPLPYQSLSLAEYVRSVLDLLLITGGPRGFK